MYTDSNSMTDEIEVSLIRGREIHEPIGLMGFGTVELFDEYGNLKDYQEFANVITTAGDQYYAQMGIVGVSPASASAPTLATGMKLGTGTTTASKSGGGAALGGYITSSNVAFDATYPQAVAVGGDGGWLAQYRSTWAAGVATNSAITEVIICNDRTDNTASTTAETYSRAVISSVNKGAGDALVITWSHKCLGT